MKYLLIDKKQRVKIDTMGKFPTADVRIMEELDKKVYPMILHIMTQLNLLS